jgi:hypothetical protein
LASIKRRLLIRVELVAARLLEALLVLAAAFAVGAEIVSAIFDYLVAQLFALGTTRTLETHDHKQNWYGKYESQSFLHFLLLRYELPKGEVADIG